MESLVPDGLKNVSVFVGVLTLESMLFSFYTVLIMSDLIHITEIDVAEQTEIFSCNFQVPKSGTHSVL